MGVGGAMPVQEDWDLTQGWGVGLCLFFFFFSSGVMGRMVRMGMV